MNTTRLIPASELIRGDRLGHLPKDVISSVKTKDFVTVFTLKTPHGDSFSEVPSTQSIRIVNRA